MAVTTLDGPATGKAFALRRAPKLLRIAYSRKRGWDALDMPGDTPKADEVIHVYERIGRPQYIFVRAAKAELSGQWAEAGYRFATTPADADVRTRERWEAWALANHHRYNGEPLPAQGDLFAATPAEARSALSGGL